MAVVSAASFLTDDQRVAMTDPGTWAWGVCTVDGFRVVFIDRPAADRYASHTHGVVIPLRAAPEAVEAKPRPIWNPAP